MNTKEETEKKEKEKVNLFPSKLYSKEKIRECRQFINDLYVSNSGENLKFVERTQYILDPKSTQLDVEVTFIAEEAFKYKHENLVKSIKNIIAESKWANHALMRYFNPEAVMQVGQKLKHLSDLEKLNMEGKSIKCNIEEGKIYLIYLWSFYKPICKKQLSLLDDIFVRNNWDNRAKFVCINMDNNREYAKKLVKLLHIDHIDNLYIDQVKNPQHPLFNITAKYGYPTAILVNSDNIIELCGSLFEIDLKEKIESLLKRETSTKMNFFPNNYLTPETIVSLRNMIKELPAKIAEKLPNAEANHLYGATLKITKVFTAQKDFDYINKKNPINEGKIQKKTLASLNYFAHSSDINMMDEIFSGICQLPKVNVTTNTVNTYEIEYKRNPICSLCKTRCCEAYLKATEKARQVRKSTIMGKKKISQINAKSEMIEKKRKEKIEKAKDKIIKDYYEYVFDDDSCNSENSDSEMEENERFFGYFYCSTCKANFCFQCGNEITDVTEVQNMHKHFLFYLHNNNRIYMKYIIDYNMKANYDRDFKYFLENAKTEKLVDIASHYQVKCDSCLAFPIKTVRWKCCNCCSKNICDDCMRLLENKDPDHYEEILWNMHQVGCDPLQHVFLKVLFDCFSY
ncbi:MAG: hypothetical protein MJ252_26755 [archaeon]|nr:hypothetical protein [archaeon]